MRVNAINLGIYKQTYNNNNLSGQKVHIKNQPISDTVSFSGKGIQSIFSKYNPVIKNFVNYQIPVHNKKIAQKLATTYTPQSFKKLFNFADKNGVFNLHFNEQTGFFKTSLISSKENHLMADLVWVTDTARYMPILKDKYPDKIVPLMENISHYYKKQERSMEKVIKNPLLYEMNYGWPNTSKNGCGHVFNPLNYKTHKWYPKTRLESVGLYMQTMADLIKNGLENTKIRFKNDPTPHALLKTIKKPPYGYFEAKQISKDTADSIGTVTKYLKSIIYPYAKSCNSWEENTFIGTATSDTAIINEGLRRIMDLMYSPTENKELLNVRKMILNSRNGDVFKDKKSLEELLKIGEYRIKNDDMAEGFKDRKYDAALSFVSHSESYSSNVIEDISQNVKRLMALEQNKIDDISEPLVRENGIIRYNRDKYINLDYDLLAKKSETTNNDEAQWFMVTDISKGYGIQLKKLLNHIEKNNGKISTEEQKLKDFLLNKETEYINRGYARITGENSYKANGKPCLPWQVPEAYQAVTTTQGIKYVPGTHTPLAWAQASLYDASKLFSENLQRIQNLTK